MAQIKNETVEAANTALRVGQVLEDIKDSSLMEYDPSASYQSGQLAVYQGTIMKAVGSVAPNQTPTTHASKWDRKLVLTTDQIAQGNYNPVSAHVLAQLLAEGESTGGTVPVADEDTLGISYRSTDEDIDEGVRDDAYVSAGGLKRYLQRFYQDFVGPTLDSVLANGNGSNRDMAVNSITVNEYPARRDNLEPTAYERINGKLVGVKTTWSRLLEYLALGSDDGVIATMRNRLAYVAEVTNGLGRFFFVEDRATIDSPYIQTQGIIHARNFRRLVTSPATSATGFFAPELAEDGSIDERTLSFSAAWQKLKPFALADLSTVDIPGDSRVAEAVFCIPEQESAPTFYRKVITSGMVGTPQTHNLNKAGAALFPTLLGPDNKSALEYMELTFPTSNTYLITYGEGVSTGFSGKLELIPIN